MFHQPLQLDCCVKMRKVERFRALQYLEEIVKKSGDVAKLRLRGKGSGFAGALVPAIRHSMGGHRQSLHHGHRIMLTTLLPLFPLCLYGSSPLPFSQYLSDFMPM